VQHARTEGELEINATCVGRCARSASAELSPLNVTVALGPGETAVAPGEVDIWRISSNAEGSGAGGEGGKGGVDSPWERALGRRRPRCIQL